MTLINFLKKPEARLLFGKKELQIIENQLLGIKLKPSETTRLSRDIKQKLKAIEQLSSHKNEFQLKKGQESNKIINQSKETILENFPSQIKQIILFGSHARKENNKISDIDLCIKLKKTKLNPTKIQARLSGQLPKKVDIQIFSKLPTKIQRTIIKEGKIIYNAEKNK